MPFARPVAAFALALAVAAPLGAPAPAAAAPPSTPYTGIDEKLIRSLLRAEVAAGMPGVYTEVRAGAEKARLAQGLADVPGERPMETYLRHRVGSITKTFVATTVLQLVAEKKVGLDAPIATYLPELLPATGPDGKPDRGGQITVRMLLQHTSGLANYTDILTTSPEAIDWARHTTIPPAVLARIGIGGAPVFAPGKGWSYSNTNYLLAGLVIERVTGKPYAEEVGRRILAPLKLANTYAPGTQPRIRGKHDRAYIAYDAAGRRDYTDFNMSWAWAAGELVSTTADLNTFYRALLTGKLLAPAQQAELLRFAETGQPGVRYGLGLLAVQLPCPTGAQWFYGHDGGTVGHLTSSLHTPDATRQVTTAENQNVWVTDAEAERVFAAKGRAQYASLCNAAPPADVAALRAARRALPRGPLG
ncbi:serine hydrolase [Pilimelia anulata]|uniref:Serine hydrolase n=1 Tax=Pilimelia anulata TaxID=53371 RepID=A0A8J3BET6_9ACTN|nr:serine hydrolase domain-containing protein [Pilimelia anulata]GGK02182.1 serine hydrolase [Pilimelia anulata]